jgi:hypothetical protein
MLFKRLVAAVASLTVVQRDEDPDDLGSILAGHKNLTRYYSLIKVRLGSSKNALALSLNTSFRNIQTFYSSFRAIAASL